MVEERNSYLVSKALKTFMMGVCIFGFNSIVMHTLGDDGRPFNPILKETPQGFEHLGLKLVSGSSSTIDDKYKYDQNMVFMTFKRNS